MTENKHESAVVSYSDNISIEARKKIYSNLLAYPATPEESERSLGLFVRGSLLARFLATKELYDQILNLPGVILDLGTWRGQTAVLCENLRAVLEPLHLNRRIACFDTFEGYVGFGEKDLPTDLHADGTYKVGQDYDSYLSELLELHEKSNAMGHNYGKHKVFKGDIRETLPTFFKENPGEVVSLAFFDLNSYAPTSSSFKTVYDRLVPGGVIAFWQLTRNTIPAEGMVYSNEILRSYKHKIKRAQYYPGLCYIVKE
ncbi:TylF/MycF/NovP-related O-methyltransferase [Halobacteriovorax sp. JY17]|uniref:TylF/MycF/NovP-related O-methyltransferase n=1 Tax=Halobacteriovorax sp. JY17 TaxID=2014617 RepID=UPI000C38F823|nr:TylF/MycF/NovP-related O-methyltransferase [Halobacteriovorax sp. JY17]PIK14680.1 MAG: hypothetical protein CES88_10100 [Halobacteriovorax sp. JY17]